MKKIFLLFFLLLFFFGASAQTFEQKTFCKISLFFDWNKTDLTPSAEVELSKLLDGLKAYPDAVICIVGWTDKTGSKRANASMSMRRAKSVKKYLEQHGITAGKIVVKGEGVDFTATDNTVARRADIAVTVYVVTESPISVVKSESEQQKEQSVNQTKTEYSPQVTDTLTKAKIATVPVKYCKFSLRTNILCWLGGILNFGMEWQPSSSVGILMNGGYAPFASNGWKHNWGGWFISPEVRWYLGEQKCWFVGSQFLAGDYNIKPGDTGSQGTILAGGIIGGYKMELSKYLDIDFSLGLGYGQLKYDTYCRNGNGYNVFTGHDITKNIFIPTQIGVGLVWKIK